MHDPREQDPPAQDPPTRDSGTGEGPQRRVTLLTDFGTRDGYVAAMKGVVASRAPRAILDDVGHDLPRGDVAHAAWTFGRFWRRFPSGTVHLVVVDPGVGTDRAAVAVACADRWAVAPDNGVLTPLFRCGVPWQAVRLAVPEGSSTTFHGRDVFAPAAGALAAGVPLEELGPPLERPVLLDPLVQDLPSENRGERTREGAVQVEGVVRVVDRFGNLVSDLPAEALRGVQGVEIAGVRIPVARTYAAVEPGSLLALASSDGTVEVAARDASAARLLDAGPGTRLRILPEVSG